MEARSTVLFFDAQRQLTENTNGAAATSAALTDVAFSWRGNAKAVVIDVRLTVRRLTRAARAHVATAERHAACLHVIRAMQAA